MARVDFDYLVGGERQRLQPGRTGVPRLQYSGREGAGAEEEMELSLAPVKAGAWPTW